MTELKALQDAATAFDQDLPRGDAAWMAEADAALFEALTRDLPSAPAHFLATIAADPAPDLLRRLLHDRMQAIGTGTSDDDETLDFPFDPETGAPGTEAPAPPPKLVEALLRAGRGERVHPRCTILPDGSRCDCHEHTATCTGQRPRFAKWRTLATTDPVTLTAWWTRWPTADVGAAGGGNRQGGGFARSTRDAAIRLLIELVDDQPSITSHATGLRRAADNVGISYRTLQRAAEEMGIESKVEVGGGFQYWVWYWPAKAQQTFYERGAGNVALMDAVLRDRNALP